MISFFVPGVPVPKGSTKAFVIKGRPVVTHDNKRTKPWEQAVIAAALEQQYERKADAAFGVVMIFYMPRPKSHYGKNGLKPSAPRRPKVKPDLDKLARTVNDGLTVAGIWADDSCVVSQLAHKNYESDENPPGVRIKVMRWPGGLQP